MNLSQHFTLEEMTVSQVAVRLGIDNQPMRDVIDALKYTAAGLERIRAITKRPIVITSGYRSPHLNKIVGGSVDSQHILGEAADIICPGWGTAYDLALLIEEHVLAINPDQVIFELGRWVHVSFSITPRRQVLTLRSRAEGFIPGIVSMDAMVA